MNSPAARSETHVPGVPGALARALANPRVTKTPYQVALLSGEAPWSGRGGKGSAEYRRIREGYLKRLQAAAEPLGWKLRLDLVRRGNTRVKALVAVGPGGEVVPYHGP